MEKKYNLIFTGKFVENTDEYIAKDSVIKALKLNDSQAKLFFSGNKTVIQKDKMLEELAPLNNFLITKGLITFIEEIDIIQSDTISQLNKNTKADKLQAPSTTTHTTQTPYSFKKIIIFILSLAILIGVSGTIYYFLVIVPERESVAAELIREQIHAQERIENERIENENRIAFEKEEQEQEKKRLIALQQTIAKEKYDSCVKNSYTIYNEAWEKSCKFKAEYNAKNLGPCLERAKTYKYKDIIEQSRQSCYQIYDETEYNPDCRLSTEVSNRLASQKKENEEKCYFNYQNGF